MTTVSPVDFRILAELHVRPFASQKELARAARVSGATVSNRLNRLHTEGILEGFWVCPLAESLGRREVHTSYAAREDVRFEEVIAADDVVLVNERHDGSYSIFSARPQDEKEAALALTELLGEPVFRSPPETPTVDATLSPLDWRLLGALVDSPRASATELAKACRLAAKTVRKRRHALVTKGLVRGGPLLRLDRAQGMVIFELPVTLREAIPVQRMDSIMPGGVVIGRTGDRRGLYFFVHAPTVQEAFVIAGRVAKNPLVKEAQPVFPRRRGFAADRVRTWILRELDKWRRT